MSAVYRELERRGLATEHDAADVIRALANGRRFKEAASLKARHPALPLSLPAFVASPAPGEGSERLVYEFDGRWDRLALKRLDTDGRRVYMAMFTGCSVSEEALNDLLADHSASRIMRTRGALLAHRFDAQGIWKWREQFSYPSVYLVRGRDSFPRFDFASSPHFYFTRDGEVVAELDGWDEDSLALWRDAWEKTAYSQPPPTELR